MRVLIEAFNGRQFVFAFSFQSSSISKEFFSNPFSVYRTLNLSGMRLLL
jgi:hypothetical protein